MSFKFTCLCPWDLLCAPPGVGGAQVIPLLLGALRGNDFLLVLHWLCQGCVDHKLAFERSSVQLKPRSGCLQSVSPFSKF